MAKPVTELDSELIENIKKTFKILKVFGFATFTVENGKSVTKPRDLYFLLQNICIGILLIFISIKYKTALGTSKSVVADYGNFVTYIASLVIALISMVVSFIHRHRTWRNVIKMSQVDTKMKRIGFFKAYGHIAVIVRAGIFGTMFMSIPLSISIYFIEKSLLKACLYWYSAIYFIISTGSVIGLLNGTFVRLKSVTRLCQSILDDQNKVRPIDSSKNYPDNIKLIGAGFEAYGDLMGIYDSMNICNGLQVMLGCGLVYFYSIFTAFMVFRDWRDDGSLNSITIASIMYATYLHVFTSTLIYVCHLVEEEPKRTVKILNAILRRSKSEVETAMLISFNLLINRRSPKFSCGLFDFDWGLVYTVSFLFYFKVLCVHISNQYYLNKITTNYLSQIIASSTTNFIILMQFDMAASSESK